MPVITVLQPDDVAKVAMIEARQHLTPWRASSFEDALYNGWHARVLRKTDQADAPMLGYFVAMSAGDDEELLTMTVAPEYTGRGYGRLLLETLLTEATTRGAVRLFLEVRQSNQRAIGLYTSVGFTIVGMRKNYYAIPADDEQGRPAGRENALLMVRVLQDATT